MPVETSTAKLVDVNPLPHPTIELVVDGSRSNGAYAVLDICLPRGLDIPRHVRRGHSGVAHLLDGALELREDDDPPVVIRQGLIRLAECRPVAVRVLEAARLVAVLVPAAAARLIPAAADHAFSPMTGPPSCGRRNHDAAVAPAHDSERLFHPECLRQLRAPADVELAVRTPEMDLDGLERHEQRLGDLAVAQAPGGQLRDATFGGRERLHAGERDPLRPGAGDHELLVDALLQPDRPAAVGQLASFSQRLARLTR